ncbi:hypothetical protein D1AOALGA4SA_893 [Olavius algarvensis Delta 1 endosymbiont]|nr:hypothetical protein D1AOALGA4SA_893 [Olavius algarvensis Delta 1 endosymbiont]
MLYGKLSNESEQYQRARAELLKAEMALRDQRERVAELRRGLPLDTQIDDYLFHEGPSDLEQDSPIAEVRLSELFTKAGKPLLLYQYMFGGAQKESCPMCAMWTDGFNAIAPHLQQRVNFAVVAQGEITDFRAWARRRRWNNLRLISSAGSSFKTDLSFQDHNEEQLPGVSVFVKADDGSLRHFYSASAIMEENEYRGLDLFTPVWNLLDLTPDGRGDWFPAVQYD